MMVSPRIAVISLVFLGSLSSASLAAENGRLSDTDGAASARAVSAGSCGSLSATNFKTDSATSASTTSSGFVDVPNSGVSFTQGGSSNGCVIVSFSGESYAPSGRLLLLQARLDSSSTASPGIVQFSGDDDENGNSKWARSHAFNFVFQSVAPGPHFVTIRYRTATSGRRVFMGKHATVIQHQ